jgi:hypothetical protein
VDVLDPIARNLSMAENDPDVVVTCVYDSGCAEWIAALRKSGWSRAQVFTVCIGMDSFVDTVGATDAMFMTGISPWDPSLSAQDDVVGWTAMEFADLFYANTQFDSDAIATVLANEEFTTLYGNLSFDANGQSKAPSLFLQYDINTTVQTVYPLDASSGTLVYPMPTWLHRDCMFKSTWETGSVSTVIGKCQKDGSCQCIDKNARSSGTGVNASCLYIPEEEMTFINQGLLALGYALFCIQACMSMSCVAWTIYYREHKVVKASQPLFLCLISFGALVMSLGIIPICVQDTDSSNKVDWACMATPWLFSMGFSIIFSALFAKITRIWIVWKASQQMRPKVCIHPLCILYGLP